MYDTVIGHVEGYKNFYKASQHGDPVNLWDMEGMSFTMDTFREEASKQLECLRNKEVPVHPILACLARRWSEAPAESSEAAIVEPAAPGAAPEAANTHTPSDNDLQLLCRLFDDADAAIASGTDPTRFYSEASGQTNPERAKEEISQLSGEVLKQYGIDLSSIVRSVLQI
ncbi:MAG: hypothetical protein HUJ66_05980 [Oscillospiraceae bacterium]|nr:hypothetical protein [Oscillospiraceae bacterium]